MKGCLGMGVELQGSARVRRTPGPMGGWRRGRPGRPQVLHGSSSVPIRPRRHRNRPDRGRTRMRVGLQRGWTRSWPDQSPASGLGRWGFSRTAAPWARGRPRSAAREEGRWGSSQTVAPWARGRSRSAAREGGCWALGNRRVRRARAGAAPGREASHTSGLGAGPAVAARPSSDRLRRTATVPSGERVGGSASQ